MSEGIQHIIKQVGHRIKSIRESKGLSQLDVATKCDAEKTTISRLEAGRTNATIKTFIKIAKALDVELYELLKID